MKEDENCPKCDDDMEPISERGGGRVGWFCWNCRAIQPDDGVEVL